MTSSPSPERLRSPPSASPAMLQRPQHSADSGGSVVATRCCCGWSTGSAGGCGDHRQAADQHSTPWHGMSPKPPGDNVFINVGPGESFRSNMPDDHPQGLHCTLAPSRVRGSPDPFRPLWHVFVDVCRESLPELARLREGPWCPRTSTCLAGPRRPGPSTALRTHRSVAGGRAPDLGDRQSWRRELFQPEARGAPVLGAGA